MKKTIVLILLVFLLPFGNKGSVLQTINLDALEIFEPQRMAVHEQAIFILDKATWRIFKLENGKVTQTFGKRGEGPGEYKKPGNIGFFENSLWVSDSGGKIVFFTPDGRLINHEEEKLQNYQFRNLRALLGEKKRIETSLLFDERGKMMKTHMYRNDQKSIILAVVQTSLNTMLTGLLTFSDAKMAVGAGKCFVVPDDYAYRVKVFSLATESFTAEIEEKDYQPVPLEGKELAELKAMVGRLSEQKSQTIQEEFKIPRHHKAIENIWSDEADNLYLLENKKREGKNKLRIYDSSLRLVKEKYLNKPLWAAFSGGRMYSIREDEGIHFLEIIEIL